MQQELLVLKDSGSELEIKVNFRFTFTSFFLKVFFLFGGFFSWIPDAGIRASAYFPHAVFSDCEIYHGHEYSVKLKIRL